MVLRAQQPAVARIAKTVDAEDVVPEPRDEHHLGAWHGRVDLPDEVEGAEGVVLASKHQARNIRRHRSEGITSRLNAPGTTRLRVRICLTEGRGVDIWDL